MKIVGITGAVAGGKSTLAAQMRLDLLEQGISAEVVSSDDFLFPNEELEKRGILQEKGFPRSHNTPEMRAFLELLRAGKSARAPIYSHATYNISGSREISPPDVLIFEGVGLSGALDLLDELVFLDTPLEEAFERYLTRVRKLTLAARADPNSFYAQFAHLSEQELVARATAVWEAVNLKNYQEWILPLRAHADRVV